MTQKVWGDMYRATTVCVDSYHANSLAGTFHNPCQPEGIAFHSTTQLLLEIEAMLDRIEQPKAFSAARFFTKPPGTAGKKVHPVQLHGNLATFRLRILFRQNASWQGSVIWLEGRQEQSFRSVLELLQLIHSALSCQEAS